MIVTVLWEDQRGVQAKGFGPHELLLSAVADVLKVERNRLEQFISSSPKKGNGNVMRELKDRLSKLQKSGPVVAVLDRDRVADLWKTRADVAKCMSGQLKQFRNDAPGGYELVFLVQNVESLTDAAGLPPGNKPSPDERDRILSRAAWDPQQRKQILDRVPSFARLVEKVANLVRITV